MAMDKEDLMNLLQIKMEYSEGTQAQGEVITGLRIVIALIEIRESIDQLRGSINDLGNQLEIRDTLEGKDVRPPCPIDEGKDTRSAGIG